MTYPDAPLDLSQFSQAAAENEQLRMEISVLQRLLATMSNVYAGGKAIINDEDMARCPQHVHVVRDEASHRLLIWVGGLQISPEAVIDQAKALTSNDDNQTTIEDINPNDIADGTVPVE